MLEKTIEYFNKNVADIENAVAQDADILQLQKLDEALKQTFQEIRTFKTDCQRLRKIQLEFFLDYISKLSENPLVSELTEITRGLVGSYVDVAGAPDRMNQGGMPASSENISARL
ncbi:MAG: hypothetical protein QM488_02160 [Rhizobiaceae bacterium]